MFEMSSKEYDLHKKTAARTKDYADAGSRSVVLLNNTGLLQHGFAVYPIDGRPRYFANIPPIPVR